MLAYRLSPVVFHHCQLLHYSTLSGMKKDHYRTAFLYNINQPTQSYEYTNITTHIRKGNDYQTIIYI